MEELKQSRLFNLVSKSLVESLLGGFIKDLNSLICKVKYLNHLNQKDIIINSIYQKCENELSLSTIESVHLLLQHTETYVRHVHNESEFYDLRNILIHLTHNKSFFSVCSALINSTAATLLTLILGNQLIYASKLVSEIENYLFCQKKNPTKELSDLLEMKYGIFKFAQYKIFPFIMDTDIEIIGGSKELSLSDEITELLELPLKSPVLDRMYTLMAEKGLFIDNYAEYMAGLKIQEITDKQLLTKGKNLLDRASRYSKGYNLDGAVISPLSSDDKIRLTKQDLKKFAILDYLFTIRIIANCIKAKSVTHKNPASGSILTITSPFKIVTVPGK